MRITGATLLGLSMLASACGSGGVSNPGRGSSTLAVEARVNADNRVVNAQSASDFGVEFQVRVTKNGAALQGAMVDFDSDLGKVALTEMQDAGVYKGGQSGYARTYTLGVHLGDDFVEDVALSGPEAFSFSAPLLGAQAVAGMPLEVKWSPSGATTASLETRQLDHVAVADTGSYTVPPGGLKTPDPGKTEDERVQVTRSESLNINGAAAGSELRISVTNEITFLVVSQ